MKIAEISAWEAFVSVAEQGNFSRASRALRLTPPQLSKRVAKLEEQLGVRLFQRSTRVVTLTDEGQSLVPKIKSILSELKNVESIFERQKKDLAGTVKISCVPFVAHKLLLPVLEKFKKKHAKVHVEIELTKKFVNIIEEGVDIAIRIETPKDSDLIYKKLAPNHLVLCASPDYIKNAKATLKDPMDLKNHELLMLSIHHRCHFKDTKLQLKEFVTSKRITCENGAFLTDMALKGSGILVRSIWDVQEHLKKGELVPVLKKYPLETFGDIYAVISNSRFLAPRVRVLLDFIVENATTWK